MPTAPAMPTRAPDAGNYCREARRLRARYGTRPAELHARLGRLAQCGSVTNRGESPGIAKSNPEGIVATRRSRGVTPAIPAVLPPSAPHAAERFARLVADESSGAVLRYAQRATLLRAARRMGIGRFDANLIIAAVEHRVAPGASLAASQDDAPNTSEPSGFSFTILGVTGCVLVEGVLAAWWVLA